MQISSVSSAGGNELAEVRKSGNVSKGGVAALRPSNVEAIEAKLKQQSAASTAPSAPGANLNIYA